MTMTRRTLLTAPALVAAATLPPALASARPAEPVTQQLLDSYNCWLHYERRYLAMAMYPHLGTRADRAIPADNPAFGWHFTYYDEPARPSPTTRAALVLDAVGCDWRA